MDRYKSLYTVPATLHPLARETSFREFYSIRKVYKEILGLGFVDHFSINVVDHLDRMLVFSINPEIAYTLYSTKLGIIQDQAISPTFYENHDSYLWEDCYSEKNKFILEKKETKYGIKAGCVLVSKCIGKYSLMSLATKSNRENFLSDLAADKIFYEKMGNYCLQMLSESILKYVYTPERSYENNVSEIKCD